jgi:murein L,D-transpeptidase YafK
MKTLNARLVVVMLVALLPSNSASVTFKHQQLRHSRVRAAYSEKEAGIRGLFQSRSIAYPPGRILLRVFKLDQVLELWAGSVRDGRMELLKQYPVCYSSGDPGPKRRQGDNQVPEGFYTIEQFNPVSNFHLSLKVSYPNSSDRVLGGRANLGGDIFIHGNCVSIGCVAITDDLIKEVYVIAVEARAAGQTAIPVHIFPARFDQGGVSKLLKRFPEQSPLWPFWRNLKEGYDFFESRRKLPVIAIARDGRYSFR